MSFNFNAAFQYPFKRPGWFVNALMMLVCLLIPVVGPLVLMGYQVLLTKSVIRDPSAPPLKFDFALFSQYLQRGIAPFVVTLIASIAIVPMIALSWSPFFIALIMTGGDKHGDTTVLIGVLSSVALEVLAIMLVSFLMVPLQLKAELEGQIMPSFDFKYLRTFAFRMWIPIIVMSFALMAIGLLAFIVGFLMCIVGIYLNITIVMMMQSHLRAQLYLISLERGVPPLEIVHDDLVAMGPAGFEPVMNK